MCEIKYKGRKCCLEHTDVKYNLMRLKCLYCQKNYQKSIDENSKKRFADTYKFAYHNINKFIQLLREGV